MDKKTEQLERLSALADGQLEGDALAQALELACRDASARDAWQAWHVVGDVLRSAELAPAASSARMFVRLQEQLRNEPPLAPAVAVKPIEVRPAANDSDFRWKLAAGFASVAAVAAIGWNMVGSATQVQGPQLAVAAPAAVPVAAASSERFVMIRDPHLDRLLAAHRQMGGATALQSPAGFMRNATFEAPAR